MVGVNRLRKGARFHSLPTPNQSPSTPLILPDFCYTLQKILAQPGALDLEHVSCLSAPPPRPTRLFQVRTAHSAQKAKTKNTVLMWKVCRLALPSRRANPTKSLPSSTVVEDAQKPHPPRSIVSGRQHSHSTHTEHTAVRSPNVGRNRSTQRKPALLPPLRIVRRFISLFLEATGWLRTNITSALSGKATSAEMTPGYGYGCALYPDPRKNRAAAAGWPGWPDSIISRVANPQQNPRVELKHNNSRARTERTG